MQNSSYASAYIAGICCIAGCIFILALPSLQVKYFSIPLGDTLIIGSFLLFTIPLCFHLYGYVRFGTEQNSNLVTISGYWMISLFVLVVLAVMSTLFVDEFAAPETELANAAIGLLLTLLALPWLCFAIGMFTIRSAIGIFPAIIAISIIPIAAIFLWDPWPTALVIAASTYFFYSRR